MASLVPRISEVDWIWFRDWSWRTRPYPHVQFSDKTSSRTGDPVSRPPILLLTIYYILIIISILEGVTEIIPKA